MKIFCNNHFINVHIKCLAGLIDGGNMVQSLTKNESFLPQPTEQKVLLFIFIVHHYPSLTNVIV